ncbi:phage recombination protein Bet [Xanthovirga aplysinae]|uniref:phage recombination protein Bet n=1 Tax=Xanthovirga aplysinae TaxID=2529853 RepID=UPI0012BB708E|nr:phage recombination protein Bet [Xanthovirga aplysinae]MTI30210.1 phage recombination protein Bet [Xanthovirga aplysinae]
MTAVKKLEPVNTEVSEVVSEEKLLGFLNLVPSAKNLNQGEKTQFLEVCKAFGLNPFKREIHVSKYGKEATIVIGYEVYIKRAEATGLLDGWEVEVKGKEDEMEATVTIFRKDWSKPFRWTSYYDEAKQLKSDGNVNRFWDKMPRTMLKKVAISQGFRLCFKELQGLPYTKEEMGVETKDVDFTVVDQKPETVKESKQEQEPPKTVIEKFNRMKELANNPVLPKNFWKEKVEPKIAAMQEKDIDIKIKELEECIAKRSASKQNSNQN